MIFFANSYLAGAVGFVVGALLVFLFLRWREQTLRKARALEGQSMLETARREAETLVREARLRANEEALRQRQETEQSFGTRSKQMAETEARLTEREQLVTRQLDNIVTQEQTLRTQAQELQAQNIALETQRQELAALRKERVEALAATGKLTEAEARAQLLKEVEQQATADAGMLACASMARLSSRG